MKKISMTLALLAATLGAVTTTQAANNGTLNFTGALTNTSCEVSSGGGSADNIPVDLGRVSFADIGNRTDARLGTAKDIDLVVTCLQPAAENTVHMSFRPSQTDTNDPYLLTTAGAPRASGSAWYAATATLSSISRTLPTPLTAFSRPAVPARAASWR
ncbi:type 1 fimbrial protein [Pseudomonas sp. PCH446]